MGMHLPRVTLYFTTSFETGFGLGTVLARIRLIVEKVEACTMILGNIILCI